MQAVDILGDSTGRDGAGRLSTGPDPCRSGGSSPPDSAVVAATTPWRADALLSFVTGNRDAVAPGGVVSARLLRRHGDPHDALDDLLGNGGLRRLRRGWYCLPDADEEVVLAVSSGGVLTCVSALRFHSVWVPRSDAVHARPARESVALQAGLEQCRVSRRLPAPVLAVDPVALALRAASGCLSREYLVAAVDSALDSGLVRRRDLDRSLWWSPGRAHDVLAHTDWAQSGTESLVRERLRGQRLRVRTQVTIDGVGRVDLLVGDRLVIETDSAAHHSGVDAYREDRRRDLQLTALGYRVLRVSWEQVINEWPAVLRAIRRIVDAGDHRWAV